MNATSEEPPMGGAGRWEGGTWHWSPLLCPPPSSSAAWNLPGTNVQEYCERDELLCDCMLAACVLWQQRSANAKSNKLTVYALWTCLGHNTLTTVVWRRLKTTALGTMGLHTHMVGWTMCARHTMPYQGEQLHRYQHLVVALRRFVGFLTRIRTFGLGWSTNLLVWTPGTGCRLPCVLALSPRTVWERSQNEMTTIHQNTTPEFPSAKMTWTNREGHPLGSQPCLQMVRSDKTRIFWISAHSHSHCLSAVIKLDWKV